MGLLLPDNLYYFSAAIVQNKWEKVKGFMVLKF